MQSRCLLILRFSPFFSLSVRGNKRTPICPRKTKNLFHTRRRFLAFSAAPRHQIPSLFSRAFGEQESDAITKTQITGAPSADRLATIIFTPRRPVAAFHFLNRFFLPSDLPLSTTVFPAVCNFIEIRLPAF